MLTDAEVTRLLDVANAGVNKGEVALARQVYDGILACRPDHVPTKISRALSFTAVGAYDDAKAILDAVLADHPDDADALVYQGLNAKLAGNTDAAREILARVPAEGAAGKLAQSLLETL